MQRFTIKVWGGAISAVALALLAGCANERVILLDDEHGETGSIEMRTERHVLVIDTPLTTAASAPYYDDQLLAEALLSLV